MIVIDASAMVHWLVQTPTGLLVDRRIGPAGETLHAPHLLDVEVVNGLRRYAISFGLPGWRCRELLWDLQEASIARYSHDDYVGRMWDLRNNVSVYDATYIVLAEALDAPLVTCDRRLAATSGHRARIEFIAG